MIGLPTTFIRELRNRLSRPLPDANAIWTRWLREIKPTLNKRAKWFFSPESHIKTGDLVDMIEDNSPRRHYPLARVNSFNCGNEVTSVTGENTRPIVKLAHVLIPLGAEDVSSANYASVL